MKSRLFDGVVYVQASEIARKYNYTTDYVGQLARAEKITARLAGRTWYVEEKSLITYKKRDFVPPTPKAVVPRKKKPVTVEKEVLAPAPKIAVPKRKRVAKKKVVPRKVVAETVPVVAQESEPAPVVERTSLWQKVRTWWGK